MDSNEKPQRKPYFWPVLFLSAFVTAALLWVVWMYAIVQRTRRQQQNQFYVPQGGPPTSNISTSAAPTNVPVIPTNPASGQQK